MNLRARCLAWGGCSVHGGGKGGTEGRRGRIKRKRRRQEEDGSGNGRCDPSWPKSRDLTRCSDALVLRVGPMEQQH